MLYLLRLLLLVALIAQLVPGTALADMVPRYNDDTWVTHGTQNLAIASFIASLMLGAGAAAYVWRAKQPLSRVSAIIGFGLILAAAGFFVLFVLFQFSAFSMAAQDKRKAEDHERALREWREARPDSGK